MKPDLIKPQQKKRKTSSAPSFLQQAQDVLIDLTKALQKKKKAWLQIRKDNPHFEEVSEEYWREKSSRCWLHGATELSESNELDQWLHTNVGRSKLFQKRTSYLIGLWNKSMKKKGVWGHSYTDNRKFFVKSKMGETLICFIIRMATETESIGKGHKTTWRALKSFLHFLRETYPQEEVAFIEHIFPEEMDVVHNRIIRKIPSEFYPIPLETAGDIIQELTAMCTEGRPDAQLGLAETLGFCWLCLTASRLRLPTTVEMIYMTKASAIDLNEEFPNLIMRHRNGLEAAVRKIGKRLYIRKDIFDSWIKKQAGGHS